MARGLTNKQVARLTELLSRVTCSQAEQIGAMFPSHFGSPRERSSETQYYYRFMKEIGYSSAEAHEILDLAN